MCHLFNRGKKMLFQCVISMLISLWIGNVVLGQDNGWPREIERPKGKIMIYQPQLESFEGDRLKSRAAVSVTLKDAEPVFGAVWFDARVMTDRDTRMVSLLEVNIPDLKFPNATDEQLKRLTEIIKEEIPKWDLTISLDRLLTGLELIEKKKQMVGRLKNDPPVILFAQHPSVLVTIDGKPELRPVEKSQLMRVVNTPFLIVLETGSKTYYLKGGSEWLSASDIMGPWKTSENPPAEVLATATDNDTESPTTTSAPSPMDEKPQIIVATEPTELIVSEGAPKYTPLTGTGLLYMSNTESDIFMEISSQQLYVLLTGRWFSSKSLKGPWAYVPSDKLPEDFSKISEDSEKGYVRAQVAGTDESVEAVQEAYIPQTARIDRSKASITVEYEGEPRFEKIDNTSMEYAVNTSENVIKVGDKYYCCHEAVWYVADDPEGPWTVCASVPSDIYQIPPSCPMYPVTYVQVYETTPTEVYVGYTPGYVGSYVYDGTVVYGTGYPYHGWCGGSYYYPRPVTYGFGAHYNWVNGNWGFRVGAAGPNGWIVGGYRNGKYYTGWWAAGGRYGGIHGGWWGNNRYPVATPYRGNINRNVNVGNINVGNRVGVGNRYDYGRRYDYGHRNNIYNRQGNLDRNIRQTPRVNQPIAGVRPGGVSPAQRPANNVFADRDGSVYRRTNDGWQRRERNDWTRSASPTISDRSRTSGGTGLDRRSVTPQQRVQPSQRPSNISRKPSSFERDYQARQRGTVRTNNYQRYQSSSMSRSPSRSGGSGYRGGGGGGFRGGGGGRGGGRR
jgi:hypothetical protein